MESGQETNSKKEMVARNPSSLMSPATQLKNEDPLAQPLSTVYVWPIILFLLAMLAFDLCSIQLISSLISARATQIYMSLAIGVLSGQACFVTILAGLWSKDWLVGLVVASSLSGLGVFLMFLGTYFDFLNPTTNVSLFVGPEQGGFWGFFMIPLIAMGAALPFYGLRYWFGWHLTRKNEGPTQSTGGIEGLLIATAIVAAVLFVARVPLVARDTQSAQFWPAIFIGIAWLTFLSVVALIPATWISFRIEPSGRKLASQFGLVVVFVIGVLGLGVLFQTANRGGGPQFVEMFVYTVLTVGIAASVVFAGLWTLIFSGYRLAKLNNRSKTAARVVKPQRAVQADVNSTAIPIVGERPELAHAGSNPESFDKVVGDVVQDRPTVITPIGVKRHRRIAGVVFCLALLSSVAVARIESQRKNTIVRQNEMANELAKGGGSIVVQQRKVTKLVVGRNATNESLAEFLHLSDVETLSLANSQITDEVIEQLASFPNLTTLDLSNTDITSAVVPELVKLRQLQDLSVASTNLNVDDVKRLLSSATHHLHSIDISSLSLSKADLQRLVPRLPPSFSIRGYGLDDTAMLEVLQSAQTIQTSTRARFPLLPTVNGCNVDLSDNPIDGSCLDGSPVFFRELRLNNTAVSDAVFGPILRKLKVERLCLANTPLTDAILKDIAASPNLTSLELGNGQITEAGLAKSRLMLLSSLALNSQQFTGVCFKSWRPSLHSLDMSGSGLNDETVPHLQNLGWVRFNLSNTEITDAALPALAKALSLEVDLSHTKITADGLMNGDLQNFTRVIVAAGQFTPEEIARIKSVIHLVVGEKSRY